MMEWLALGSILLMIGALVYYGVTPSMIFNSDRTYSYQQSNTLIPKAERELFLSISEAIGDHALLLTKVPASRVLEPSDELSKAASRHASRQLSSETIDYLICDSDDHSVKAVIQIISEKESKHADGPNMLQDACESAEIHYYSLPLDGNHDSRDIRELLFDNLDISESDDSLASENPDSDSYQRSHITVVDTSEHVPTQKEVKKSVEPRLHIKKTKLCPLCQLPLMRKVAAKGRHKGSRFIACKNFPVCNYIIKMKEK